MPLRDYNAKNISNSVIHECKELNIIHYEKYLFAKVNFWKYQRCLV